MNDTGYNSTRVSFFFFRAVQKSMDREFFSIYNYKIIDTSFSCELFIVN